ncbi:hypothetical protein HK097_002534 [Rhizophlyctis rosea]|uniref:GH18 domain-containing protein n=1 Tax=Rhizophlyctis rosea TaxID=64517 RepID=A0AAD5X750_9FUNG|nr:hypothetical protein HK097_002534 [Rhizophlyctis rosea]
MEDAFAMWISVAHTHSEPQTITVGPPQTTVVRAAVTLHLVPAGVTQLSPQHPQHPQRPRQLADQRLPPPFCPARRAKHLLPPLRPPVPPHHALQMDHSLSDTAFAMPEANGTLSWEGPNLSRFAVEAKKAGTKVLVAFGGWSGSYGFSRMVANTTTRRIFVNNAVGIVNSNALDGVDLDWEYPGSAGETNNFNASSDVRNFLTLLQDLRLALGPAKLITAAVAGQTWQINGIPATNLSSHAAYFDFINLMNYDNVGAWVSRTGHDSSVQSNDAGVANWVAAGFPRSKIVTGYPFYAKIAGEVAKNSTTKGLNAAYTGYVSPYISYAELKPVLAAGNYSRSWDVGAESAWWWSSCLGRFVTAPDAQSAWSRGRLARSQGLKGVMVWEIGQDDEG